MLKSITHKSVEDGGQEKRKRHVVGDALRQWRELRVQAHFVKLDIGETGPRISDSQVARNFDHLFANSS